MKEAFTLEQKNYTHNALRSTLVMDSPVPLMHHDPDRSWITDPDLDHSEGTQPKFTVKVLK